MSNCSRPSSPYDQWPSGIDQGKLIEQIQAEFSANCPESSFNFSQYIQDNIEEGDLRGQRRELGQDRRAQSGNADAAGRSKSGTR